MSVRSAVIEQVNEVARQHGKRIGPLDDDVRLMDSGLDSLCIAVVVARLDDQLDLDPFAGDDEVAFPVTVGDFIRLYERAAA